MRLLLATGNPRKVQDFAGIITAGGVAPEAFPRFREIATAEETGGTFAANAQIKSEYYSRFTTETVLADDSGLEVDELLDAPGVDSALYAGFHGNDEANNWLLLERLRGVPEERRTARFVCCLSLAKGGVQTASFTGKAEGRILERPRGSNGFGYDPLFYSPEAGCGFGELTAETKARFSHRGAAARALREWLRR